MLLVIYLFNYDLSKSTFFMLNIGFDFSWENVLSNELEFFAPCSIKIARTAFFLFCVLVCTFLWKPNCSPSWWLKIYTTYWHLYQIYTFSNNLNDEKMKTSYLICVMKQPFCDKNIISERKKNSSRKTFADVT